MKCAKRKHDYSQIFDTLFWHALYGASMWLWYRNIFFRCFAKLTLTESRVFLLCIVILSTSLGFVIDKYILRGKVHPFINMLIGFGTYAALTYIKIKPILVITSISISIILAIVFSVRLIRKKIRYPEDRREVIHRRICRVINDSKFILSMGFGVIIAVIGISAIFGGFLIKPTVYAAQAVDSQEWTVNNNIEELALFFDEDEWRKASITTKLNTCQILANICQAKWGTNELNVVTSNADDMVDGYYNDREHLIVIKIDHLMEDPGRDVCNTVIHEAYHALEHRMVDAYLAAPDDMKELSLYKNAAIYMQEFANYQEGDDYYAYSTQLCESQARFWADYETYEIERAVYEYYGCRDAEN